MSDELIVNADLLDGACLSLEDLAAACAVEPEWIVHLVTEGYLTAQVVQASQWRFTTTHMLRVRRMRDLERDFDAVPELAALVADLLDEMDELRARIGRRGL